MIQESPHCAGALARLLCMRAQAGMHGGLVTGIWLFSSKREVLSREISILASILRVQIVSSTR